MKKIYLVSIVVVLLLIGFGYKIYRDNNPVVVTRNFYNEWINGSKYNLGDKTYQNIDVWTPQLISKIDQVVATFTKGGVDPVLCAQDKPTEFTVVPVGQTTEGSIKLQVNEEFSSGPVQVTVLLKKVKGFWKMDDIACGGEDLSGGKLEEQNLVGDYVKDHISELSPQKEVLGGKFQINKIVFGENRSGTVEYEDGHIALVADFVYLAENNTVTILTFKVRPMAEKVLIDNKEGNIVKSADNKNWDFVYEEPGAPALRATLVFNSASRCYLVDEKIPCENLNWRNGDRVAVKGQILSGQIFVDSLVKVNY